MKKSLRDHQIECLEHCLKTALECGQGFTFANFQQFISWYLGAALKGGAPGEVLAGLQSVQALDAIKQAFNKGRATHDELGQLEVI